VRPTFLWLLVLTILAGLCGEAPERAAGLPEWSRGEDSRLTFDEGHLQVTGELSLLGAAMMQGPGSAGSARAGGEGRRIEHSPLPGALGGVMAKALLPEGCHLAAIPRERPDRPVARTFLLPLLI
jgi:hypothetical protein